MENAIFNRLAGGLIVSCQALPDEPLFSSYIMSRMAYAAMEGGAVGIRTNSISDIREIKKNVDLPIIGIIKQKYKGADIVITPTMKEVEALVSEGVDIIALDCTDRPRPDGESMGDFLRKIRLKYPNQLFMADCSDYEEGMTAAHIGIDLIGTTLCGYTQYTRTAVLPNLELIRRLSTDSGKHVIAEGGIKTPDQLKAVFKAGAWAAVVGSAITRPREITRDFITGAECRTGEKTDKKGEAE
ncbi:N-acetylmannosamine-6-phosphate 2-epimerase [Clostridium boliviensis]|uniref:Putative N-acetylmannosamine-6-phosphate 2-epimerase n=1 Tax=Clostridium boliviensis TaxID=318465 RepID=A0ABU4GLM1_9CLOT|nr:N-acetylmannosamine-6-phosphate 2-epimerase [Clostridium boliviensis]MDW2798521.1 N-acetylmannosamine-6-phosphate 2-epimerase [Clostridium boliviensis]